MSGLPGLTAAEQESSVNVERFLDLVRKYTGIRELKSELIREFVEKSMVFRAERIDGRRVQRIRITWNCIGKCPPPMPQKDEKTA